MLDHLKIVLVQHYQLHDNKSAIFADNKLVLTDWDLGLVNKWVRFAKMIGEVPIMIFKPQVSDEYRTNFIKRNSKLDQINKDNLDDTKK